MGFAYDERPRYYYRWTKGEMGPTTPTELTVSLDTMWEAWAGHLYHPDNDQLILDWSDDGL